VYGKCKGVFGLQWMNYGSYPISSILFDEVFTQHAVNKSFLDDYVKFCCSKKDSAVADFMA
jgi:hypothetical protein